MEGKKQKPRALQHGALGSMCPPSRSRASEDVMAGFVVIRSLQAGRRPTLPRVNTQYHRRWGL